MLSYPGKRVLWKLGAELTWEGGTDSRRPKRQTQVSQVSLPSPLTQFRELAEAGLAWHVRGVAVNRGQTGSRTPSPERWGGRNYTSQQAARPKAPRRPLALRLPSPSGARALRTRSASRCHLGQFESLRGRRALLWRRRMLRASGAGAALFASGMLCRVSGPHTGLGFRLRVVEVCFFISLWIFVCEFDPKKGCVFEERPILWQPEGRAKGRWRGEKGEDVSCWKESVESPYGKGTTVGGGPLGGEGSRNWTEGTWRGPRGTGDVDWSGGGELGA